MNTQPEALQRIGDLEGMHERGTIKRGHIDEMLSELRRLHALNAELLEALKLMVAQFTKGSASSTVKDSEVRIKAHATIAKAESEKENPGVL